MAWLQKRNLLILVAIIILAFFLRFNQVTSNPPALNWDEVSIGYNAYSIMKTGKDEWGEPWPVHFKAFGEYKLPAQIYASIPGIWIFGLNELGVRILPVVYGTLTVLVLFFLTKEMFDSEEVGLISAFLLSISPWHIQLTRASFESSFSVFWVVLGLWLLLKAIHAKGRRLNLYLKLGILMMAVSIYTYNSARVFSPLFLLFLLWYFRGWVWKHKKSVVVAAIIFIITMIPLAQFILQTGGNSRYKLVSVTDDPGLIPRIDQARNSSKLPEALNVLINNRYTYSGFYIAQNYLAHFTPQFLFISGAPHKQHHVQGVGEMYFFQFPLVLFGLYILFRKKLKNRGLLLAWILLSFVPVAVTNDSIPNALRTLLACPPYEILSAIGAYYGYLLVKQRCLKWLPVLRGVSALVIVVAVSLYLYNYYFIYPNLYSRDWQYGYKQTVNYVQAHQAQYDEVVFSRTYGEPHIFTLFFKNYDPNLFQNDPTLNRFEDHQWIWVENFGKFYFPDLGDPGTHYKDIVAQNPGKKLLFVGKPGDFPKGQKILDQVNFLDGSGAFQITEN